MNHIKKTALQKKIELVNWILLGICLVFSFVFLSYSFALGILLGGLISIANFYWLSKDLVNLFQQIYDTAKPKQYILMRYFMRFIVTGVVLFFVITQMPVSVIGLILGLSIVVVSVILTVLIENVKKNPLRRFREKNAFLVIFR